MTTFCGGIDLGGTKIEARLFTGPQVESHSFHRIDTPTDSFDAMVAALIEQIHWLWGQAGQDIPVGVCMPGVIDPRSGACHAANIPCNGQSIQDALHHKLGKTLPVLNDAMAFTMSEAHHGAGHGAQSVFGLIMGTGIGGGYVLSGDAAFRYNGLSVEIGHIGVPARALDRNGLPSLPCGCGKSGCYETYISGRGLENLAKHLTGSKIAAPEISDHSSCDQIMKIWADIAAECIYTAQFMLDPSAIILGGGVSRIAGVIDMIYDQFEDLRFADIPAPTIALAQHGDSSGARGAAIAAQKAAAA
ncbi:hypothetical protein BVC71_02035 [Marivivens niveibacter]|uniref:N-acetylglucosamine kinase n=1 Tax=Marivivens niveibacter TaxID=1930667 RepID=A0A251X1N6_9RHOB|nr:ROK family protein [Marivivens niveibacter]OUD10315.1 hypothetical protein BVC71_02035 [Marivivens niveibacter]